MNQYHSHKSYKRLRTGNRREQWPAPLKLSGQHLIPGLFITYVQKQECKNSKLSFHEGLWLFPGKKVSWCLGLKHKTSQSILMKVYFVKDVNIGVEPVWQCSVNGFTRQN